METWDYAHCLPYFKRMENCLAADPDDAFRGHDGPLVLERGPATNPLFGAFFEAGEQAGYPLTDDVNGYRQEGFAAFDRNIHRGRRLSAARAYLHPVHEAGPTSTVTTRALVTRVLFEGKRAVGVEYQRGRGRRQQVRAGEVILCGGAINSPQLLQLSGVGNAAELRAARHRRRRTTCPASARTCRTTWRSTSSTPARSRSRCSRTCKWRYRPLDRRRSGCSCARARAPPTTSRAAASSAATRTSPTRT